MQEYFGADQATSHYINQRWPIFLTQTCITQAILWTNEGLIFTQINVPLGFNELEVYAIWKLAVLVCSMFTQHQHVCKSASPGVGVTKPISSAPLFSQFFRVIKILVTYGISHPYLTDVSCGDICEIWMWFGESNMYFCKIKNFTNREINERSFSNPHPREKLSCKQGTLAN